MRRTNIIKFAFESMDTDKLISRFNYIICIDVDPVKNMSLGSSGRGCMLRTFSEDTFKPNLVPPYVKNISVVYDSENMKKYFTYVDDYGRGENNA